eukprot:599316-Rhodomonas_salina.1
MPPDECKACRCRRHHHCCRRRRFEDRSSARNGVRGLSAHPLPVPRDLLAPSSCGHRFWFCHAAEDSAEGRDVCLLRDSATKASGVWTARIFNAKLS